MIALAAIWLAMLLGEGGSLDRSVYLALYAGSRPGLSTAAHIFTDIGEPTVVIVAGFALAAWLWWRGKGPGALQLLVIVLVGRALAEIQKFGFARPRPAIEPHLVMTKTYSFPSGHAANSMIFYLALALILATGTRWRTSAIAGAVALSLLIGTSRVMLGVHWPSDVIAGWAFGALWVLWALRVAERQTLKRKSITSPS